MHIHNAPLPLINDVAFGAPDRAGISVGVDLPTGEPWLVGTWEYDTISGPVRDIAQRVQMRRADGEPDWAPTQVFVLGWDQPGMLREADLYTFEMNGFFELFVTIPSRFTPVGAGSSRIYTVAAARFPSE